MTATTAFTINGNQENPDGNPIPYFRVTSQSKWSDGSKRYSAWKTYVVARYLDAMKALEGYIERADFGAYHDILEREPIVLPKGYTAELHIEIEWHNHAHADGDNIFKGIADALFENDKQIVKGSFVSSLAKDKKGRVSVRIIINDAMAEPSIDAMPALRSHARGA